MKCAYMVHYVAIRWFHLCFHFTYSICWAHYAQVSCFISLIIYGREEQIQPCHIAAEAWWGDASTCCQNGRPPACWCMCSAVHSFSISARPALKIHDIFEWVEWIRKTKTEPAPFHWATGIGVIPGHLFARRPERRSLFILVGASLEMVTSSTSSSEELRAGWANGSESNYWEQGDPAGTVPFDETVVLPWRYMAAERDCLRDFAWLCHCLCHACKKKCRRGGRGWGKTEMDAFCARHSVLSHIVVLCSICRPESRKSAVYTSVRVLLHVNSQP